ncbi:Hypothetical predicted protein [Olea europaea subsp. europaea]|uniref:Uncharacterized protein n=1 Tax=Olea europaea subsp. europaea TaxID=158383 RepID=A0A8S0Q3K5_OLEEU|nr:Hypothetical predicted protein [Olea europaea subsp. europaea]
MVFTQYLLLGFVAEDWDLAGFLGSGITIAAAREACHQCAIFCEHKGRFPDRNWVLVDHGLDWFSERGMGKRSRPSVNEDVAGLSQLL